MPSKELLKLVKDFSKTTYKDIYTEGYKLQLERGSDMDVLHITDTKTGKRTEVRGKTGYEIKHDPEDRLHKLLDKIGKALNISELLNGEPGINPLMEKMQNEIQTKHLMKMPGSIAKD